MEDVEEGAGGDAEVALRPVIPGRSMTERINEGTPRMSDAAQPPHSPENVPGEGASSEGSATGETASDSPASGTPARVPRVPLDKAPTGSPVGSPADSGGAARSGGTAGSGPEFDPWAPPPSGHSGPTVTSAPAAATPPSGAPQPSQTWANPFAPPGGPVAGTPQDNPFAPPAPQASYAQPAAPGEPVPPPPIAPGGPGPVPYGYPSGPGYGYPQQGGYGGPGPGPGYPAPPTYSGGPGYGWAPMAPQPSNGMGTAALVVGIVSAVIFCLWPLAIILGILAVIFGVIGRGKVRRGEATNSGQALAGIICGAVGIVIAVAFGVLVIAFGDDSDAGGFDDGYSTVLSLRG